MGMEQQMQKIVNLTREIVRLGDQAQRLPDCKAKRIIIAKIGFARSERNSLRANIK